MNILHLKHAVEVAQAGSLSKAAEALLSATPNISRSIRELESEFKITIFERTAKGMVLTSEGAEFIRFAKDILGQIDHMEHFYKNGTPKKRRFSISVPHASYISEAFAEFSRSLSSDPAELFYKESDSQHAIENILHHDYKLGIIRYAENFDRFFKSMLEEKGLAYELIAEFSYVLTMHRSSPLAQQERITFDMLSSHIEIAHADPFAPSMPLSKIIKEERPDNCNRKIFIYERASQFDLLSKNPDTFMWLSPLPKELLDRYGLVQKQCPENNVIYKDMLIYRNSYSFSDLDQEFITALCASKRKNL